MGSSWSCFCRGGNHLHVFGLNYWTHLGQTGLGYILALGAPPHYQSNPFPDISGLFYVTGIWRQSGAGFSICSRGWNFGIFRCPFNIFIGKVLATRNAVTSTGRAVF